MASVTAFAGSVPQNYETYLGPLFFEPYAADLIQRIPKQAYESVLELACGTGRVTKHLVVKLAGSGRLYATDLNEDMLRIARETVKDSRVKWSVVDAHELPFRDQTFDLVVCQYGVMFFADKPKALKEIHRVLKDGGLFIFNTWDEVRYNAVSNEANTILKETFPEDPPHFFEKGPYSLYNKDILKDLLQTAGFGTISIETVSMTGVAASPDDVVKGILDGTPVHPFLKDHSEKAGTVRQQLRESLVKQYGERDLQLPMRAIVCQAVRS